MMDKNTVCYYTPNLHNLVSQVPLCNRVLASNNDIMVNNIVTIILLYYIVTIIFYQLQCYINNRQKCEGISEECLCLISAESGSTNWI